MESKHKNALIGALLAVVFVMAVGYAAFATTLEINGTASIDTAWDVHFDPSVHTVAPTTGHAGGTAPTGTATVNDGNLTATVEAHLNQTGDQVLFTFNVKNYGTGLYAQQDAAGTSPVLSSSDNTVTLNQTALTATKGHVKYTVTTTRNVLQPQAANADVVTVLAEYTAVEENEDLSSANVSAPLTINLYYHQVAQPQP